MDAIEVAKNFLRETKPLSVFREGREIYQHNDDPRLHTARVIIENLVPIAESSLLSMEARVKAARRGPVHLASTARAVDTYSRMLSRYANADGLPSIRLLAGRLAMAAIHLAHASGVSLDSVLREAVSYYESEPCPNRRTHGTG